MALTMYFDKDNLLCIHSDAITKKCKTVQETLAYMRKPYSERIEESPYRDRINAEIAKHPGCTISEFCDGPVI